MQAASSLRRLRPARSSAQAPAAEAVAQDVEWPKGFVPRGGGRVALASSTPALASRSSNFANSSQAALLRPCRPCRGRTTLTTGAFLHREARVQCSACSSCRAAVAASASKRRHEATLSARRRAPEALSGDKQGSTSGGGREASKHARTRPAEGVRLGGGTGRGGGARQVGRAAWPWQPRGGYGQTGPAVSDTARRHRLHLLPGDTRRHALSATSATASHTSTSSSDGLPGQR